VSTPTTIENALTVLPLLVDLAQKGKTLSYGEIFKKTGVHYRSALPNALGHIRDEVCAPRKLPRLNVVAVNATTQIPGDSFLPSSVKGKPQKAKRKIFKKCLEEVFLCNKWSDLLTELKLEPLKKNPQDLIDIAKKYNGIKKNGAGAGKGKRGGTGEGKRHRLLKEYIAENPSVLGLGKYKTETEYSFPSGDKCDVFLAHSREDYAIAEIKTGDNHIDDLISGVFQAIKYRALLQAEKGGGKKIPVKAFLVAYEMPVDIIGLAKLYGIKTKIIQESDL